MNNRISQIIASLGIKRIDFAKKIGISSPFVSELCSGAKKASDRTIADICREFNVNETWLRTGEGEMFVPAPSDTLDVLTREYELSHDARVLVEEFVNLKPELQQAFVEFACRVAETFRSASAAGKDISVPAAPDTSGQERPEPDIVAELAELKRQNREKDKQLQELAAKVAAMEEEDARMEAAAELSVSTTEYAGVFEGRETKK